MIIAAPQSTAGFRPYAGSALFHQTYQPNPATGRLVNIHSLPSSPEFTRTPLIIGGLEDCSEEALRRGDQNLLLDVAGVPTYLFTYHSGTAYAATEALAFGRLVKGATLFHFDAHPDMDSNHLGIDEGLAKAYKYFHDKFQEGSWLWPLVASGQVSEIFWFSASPGPGFLNGNTMEIRRAFPALKITEVKEADLPGFDRSIISALPREKMLLSLDLDYFAFPEIDYLFDSTGLIRSMWPQAGVVSLALSPDYIKKRLAIRLARGLMATVGSAG
ncbi:hypothetical protein A2311_02960 [candidate division WOR-1 bacterium RIFOXYB2_FULL_48_7]|uniref:Arginase n=1 Tax=candidate division WOR-1 bacterium RIFOXYB2_FULL_48_7 TaxID=1802583 RepID=A0A1F4TVW8_UNCSA|nr:MAG: hypothetical protein A2311_02960 [candidate division WOR-1 bacterium RIFOXYB2_FULL_48_7]